MRVRVIVAVTGVAVSGAVAVAGSVSAERPDMCVSVNGGDANGDPQVQHGTADCVSLASDGAANVARAMGDEAVAVAGENEGDSDNRATASGDFSDAFAGVGDGNTATASGEGSSAVAAGGDGNTATASGDGSFAKAGGLGHEGDGNTAVASGDGSIAHAGDGDGNTAIASGEGNGDEECEEECYGAYALDGDSNTAIASGDFSYAFAGVGDRNTAIAPFDYCRAEANSQDDFIAIPGCP